MIAKKKAELAFDTSLIWSSLLDQSKGPFPILCVIGCFGERSQTKAVLIPYHCGL